MKEKLENIKIESFKSIDNANTIKEIEDLFSTILGKKGKLTEVLKGIALLSNEEKKEIGAFANTLKEEILGKVEQRKEELLESESIVRRFF